MTQRSTVVRNCEPVTKPRLHELLMAGWARAAAKYGKGTFCDALGITGAGYDKQVKGSMPDLETIANALTFEPDVVKDVLDDLGLRLVTKEAVCDVDDAGLLITRVLLWLREAEHPDSPGGRVVTHSELLPAEFLIRQLHQATGDWLGRINEIRGRVA